ncbi:MAG: hypothetical protein NPIRA01_12490 [Nitrospirales bacterium]|nr:MAG: hypothetical protein NPIRA01_12490 [Nitrospirales bacterium]
MNPQLRQTLLDLQRADHDMRVRLLKEDKLFQGYAKEMATVHEQNAKHLQSIIEEFGWPGQSLVGEDGARAAWLIAQHAIGLPAFQRNSLKLIHQAVKQNDMSAWTEAYLTDRIRFNERRPQVYGTIFDWDENDKLSPWPIEDCENVERRRKEVGMLPLEDDIQKMRESAKNEGNHPPTSYNARQEEIETWAKSVGWLDTESSISGPYLHQ